VLTSIPEGSNPASRAREFRLRKTDTFRCESAVVSATLAAPRNSQHYGTVILPARPAHPRDKPKIEVAVQIVERWILARLRHETFFSLATLNARIAELLGDLNARPMRLYRASRRALFTQLDQPALRPLPPSRSSTASGPSTPGSTSTITSSCAGITTRSPMRSCTSRSMGG
jgi:hypothetical protein